MSRDAHIDLANRALDGDLSEQEKAEFEAALNSDPALRGIKENISRADNLLRKATSVEPPSQLRKNILSAIRANQAAKTVHSGWFMGFISSAKHMIERQPSAGIGLGFAMGVLVLAAVSTMTNIPWNSVGGTEAVGTIGSSQIADNEAISERIDISVDGKLTGSVDYEWSNKSVGIDITLESPEAVAVTLEFDPAGLVITSINKLSESVTDINYAQGAISFTHIGSGTFSLTFERIRPELNNITLDISQAGMNLNETLIELK